VTLNIATSTGARKIHDLSELTVLLAIPTLAGGGAERVITWLAKETLCSQIYIDFVVFAM